MPSSTTHRSSVWQTLVDLGLIDEELRKRALSTLAPEISDAADITPTKALDLLLQNGLLSDEDMWEKIASYFDDEDSAERPNDIFWLGLSPAQKEEATQIVAEAFKAVLPRLRTKGLDDLLKERLITQSQSEEARAYFHQNSIIIFSPAIALRAMVVLNIVPAEAWRDLKNLKGTRTTRGKIVTETITLFEQYAAERRNILWKFIGVVALILCVIIGGIAFMYRTKYPPLCSESVVEKTLNVEFFMRSGRNNLDTTMLLRKERTAPFQLDEVDEFAYVKNERVRACMANVSNGNDSVEIAFTISPKDENDQSDSEFLVKTMRPALMKARFSRYDSAGNYTDPTLPVGKAAVLKALSAGMLELDKSVRAIMPSYGQMRSVDIKDEIVAVEGLKPCRELTAGTRYRCHLLFERKDDLMNAMGAGETVLAGGEFTFERDSPSSDWKVDADFGKDYTRASAAGRFGFAEGFPEEDPSKNTQKEGESK